MVGPLQFACDTLGGGGLAVAAGLVANAAAWHQVLLLFALVVVSALRGTADQDWMTLAHESFA